MLVKGLKQGVKLHEDLLYIFISTFCLIQNLH